MEVLRVEVFVMSIIVVGLGFVATSINGEVLPPPTSDGTAVDQGIACVLMLLALLLTYIIH
ncbi:hypothetical protein Lal_00003104 [Lupinus albus]|nr:hypothetical protein Lal_00003104 [Lupinus albus]